MAYRTDGERAGFVTRRGRREAERARLHAALRGAALAGVTLSECRLSFLGPDGAPVARCALVEVVVDPEGLLVDLRLLGEAAAPGGLVPLAEDRAARLVAGPSWAGPAF